MTPNLTVSEAQRQQDGAGGLSLADFTRIFLEIQNQPAWRSTADRQMDYADGNQLDSDILRKQQLAGIPPAIEDLIGPAVDSVCGYEAKTRTDWRITADGDDGKEVAEALNFKVNQAERKSGADRACSDAFRPQYCVGIGWVEVARERDPFKFPYRCTAVHRNEIFWDMLDREPGLPKARYLVRRRWTDAAQVKLKFPGKASLVDYANGQWRGVYEPSVDGGTSTDLATSWDQERGWSIEEQEWRDAETGRVCLFEVWYRRWESVTVFKTGDGRVVEYNPKLASHVIAVAQGYAKPIKATIARMYVSFWLGPHKLYDGKSPYRHNEFPYVQFVGKIEDRTGVPYGAVKGMMYLQDSINSYVSKVRWGLSAVVTKRTKGAYAGTDEQFRQMSSRVDADFVLDATAMKNGGIFEIERNFQLSEQQYKMLVDARTAIQRVSGLPAAFQSQPGTARSGVQESTQIEQATQNLATTMDNFRFGRTKVGELLMSLVIEDLIGKPEEVTIEGNALRPPRKVALNVPEQDPDSGIQYLTNDVERVKLKVAMNDVPTTPSFRTQQLAALSEAYKSMPQEIQVVALPHLLSLMDVPNRDELIEDVRNARQDLSPEAVQQRIDEAVKLALERSGHDLKARELELKYAPEKLRAEIDSLLAKTSDVAASAVKKTMETFFASIQAGEVIAAVPGVAPLADELIKAAGYQRPNPQGVDPDIAQPAAPLAGVALNPVKNPRTGTEFMPGSPGASAPGDTTPQTPATPASPFAGERSGIETMREDTAGAQR